jgi:hypothetical protein
MFDAPFDDIAHMMDRRPPPSGSSPAVPASRSEAPGRRPRIRAAGVRRSRRTWRRRGPGTSRRC